MAKKATNNKICATVGGQAVLEGVMMVGKTCYCTAVRDGDGDIQIERTRIKASPLVQKINKIPLLRGVVNLIASTIRGTKTIMRSASVFGEDEEPGKISKWIADKFKLNLMDVIGIASTVLGICLAVGIFMLLPNFLVGLLAEAVPIIKNNAWEFVLLGVIKLAIFLAYLGLILLMKDIRRLYQYHGAEHKTINCYESGQDLTVENVRKNSRIHDRCGTSFLFIVLFINVVCISLINWAFGVQLIENEILKFLSKVGLELMFLPIIAGVSYEILRILAKCRGKFSLIFKWPGIVIQKVFTTREPSDDQIEVAIAAFNATMEMDADGGVRESKFAVSAVLSEAVRETADTFAKNGIDVSDAEWIYAITLNKKRSELYGDNSLITLAQAKKINALIGQRLSGRPLWYVVGDTEFYGLKFFVDERVLIPRPETEILVENALKRVRSGGKVLDMCTGSGCIAVALKVENPTLDVVAADISESALCVAKHNAEYNAAEISFVQSDLFDNVSGKFDLITCNPPYVATGEIAELQSEVKNYEPMLALDGGTDGLDFYRRVACDLPRYLNDGASVILECGENQAREIIKEFGSNFTAEIIKDYSDTERFIALTFKESI